MLINADFSRRAIVAPHQYQWVASPQGGVEPAGWYLRNPPGSGHEPSSKEGAVIFVKLRQMRPHERQSVRIDTRAAASWHSEQGREARPLFSDEIEQTSLRLALGEAVFTTPVDGAELLVLTGNVVMDGESYERGSWIRLPAGQYPGIVAGAHGTTFYLKIGHPGETLMGT